MSETNILSKSNLAGFRLFPTGQQVIIRDKDGTDQSFGTVKGHEVDSKGELIIVVIAPKTSNLQFTRMGNGEILHHCYQHQLGRAL